MLSMWEKGKPLAADSGPVVRYLNPKHVGGWHVQAPAPGMTAFRHNGRGWPLEYVSFEAKGRCLMVTQSSSWYKVVSLQAGLVYPALKYTDGVRTLPATYLGTLRSLSALLPLANESITNILTEHPIMSLISSHLLLLNVILHFVPEHLVVLLSN